MAVERRLVVLKYLSRGNGQLTSFDRIKCISRLSFDRSDFHLHVLSNDFTMSQGESGWFHFHLFLLIGSYVSNSPYSRN